MPPVPEDEDAADARRVLAGDVAAFGGIVRRWQGRLINLAWRYCRDRAAAEDMAQDAFVKAFRALHTFRGESAFSTWLTAIAINVYRSWLRDRAPLPTAGEMNDLMLMRVRGAAPDALAGLQAHERAEAVRRAVLTLPPRYREPIVLYYFQEMDVSETARILGIPEGTLKARLHRGRELLKRKTAARLAPAPRITPDESDEADED
jgi:RNA polymerase sigma-70 factor, ECF subfamily